MRHVIASLTLSAVFILLSFKTTESRKPAGIHTIVIDAGHGGHDPGCQYGGAREKNVTLAIALKLGKIIKQNCKDVKVIFTRDDDTFVELWERAGISNRNQADVFISIHCNANPSSTPSGTETYTMGLHKTEGNLEVAKRENSVVLMENDYTERYDGFDPNSPEADIIFSLFQDAYLEQSIKLASHIERELAAKDNRGSRGVKQAGFLVLWKTTMPSVLIETGFLSNTADRKLLTSEQGQTNIATAIYKAFRKFKDDMESTSK